MSRVLQPWLEADASRKVTFMYVPSKIKWGPHAYCHKNLKNSLAILLGPRSPTSYDFQRKKVTDAAKDEWIHLFNQGNSYRGHCFIMLPKVLGDGDLQPGYIKGGT